MSATCFGHEDSGGWKRGNVRQGCRERLLHYVDQSGVTLEARVTFRTVRWGRDTRAHTRTQENRLNPFDSSKFNVCLSFPQTVDMLTGRCNITLEATDLPIGCTQMSGTAKKDSVVLFGLQLFFCFFF